MSFSKAPVTSTSVQKEFGIALFSKGSHEGVREISQSYSIITNSQFPIFPDKDFRGPETGRMDRV